MNFNIQVNGIQEALAKLNPEKVNKAAYRALGRAGKAGVTAASSAVRATYNIKKQDLDKRIIYKPPTYSHLSAQITMRGKASNDLLSGGRGVGISLWYFGGRIVPPTKRTVVVKRHLRLYMNSPGLFGKGIYQAIDIRQHPRAGVLKGGGIMARPLKGGKATFVKGAFKTTFQSGHTGVMIRRSKERTTTGKIKLRERSMIGITSMFENNKVDGYTVVRSRALEAFDKEFHRLLARE